MLLHFFMEITIYIPEKPIYIYIYSRLLRTDD